MNKPKKIVFVSIMIAMGIVLQAVEGFFSFGINLPGGKIGLANIVGLVLLPTFGGVVMFFASVIRALLGGILFGGVTACIYSTAGAALSSFSAIVAYKYLTKYNVTLVGVGMISAAANNTAQTIVASIMMKSTAVFSYLPVLITVSVVSGTFTGYVAQLVCKNIKQTERF